MKYLIIIIAFITISTCANAQVSISQLPTLTPSTAVADVVIPVTKGSTSYKLQGKYLGIDTVYQRNDSIFFKKYNIERFAFKSTTSLEYTGTATCTSAATANIITITTPAASGQTKLIKAYITGYNTTDSNGLAGELLIRVTNNAGTLTVGVTPIRSDDGGNSSCTIGATASGTNLIITVGGLNSKTINYTGKAILY